MKFEMTDIPERIAKLPRDFRGFPVPWFVAWVDGKPQFPIMDREKLIKAIRHKFCWVCGESLGANKVFVIGPMCAINLTSSEPPSHLDCAEFSVKACPFLVNRNQKRIESALTKQCSAAGEMIKRNPGVALLWNTKSYQTFSDHKGGLLIRLGKATSIMAFANGERLTDFSVLEESIESGIPLLEAVCQSSRERQALGFAVNKMWETLSAHGLQ